ncbi:lipopolysaccharide biosynthesis protein [Limosilactobacillus vaginalis]|uniref:lipopolysaccharide biosynthesis protein n=1 Tax=Limosilactobacillus vaginalis TaxID=1633 RepID=UPI0022E0E4D1|nr:oligosaccharide flippase family protein [Limosilactobacillus vaginalis]
MGKYKYLLKNIGLLTLGNFATKLLSFFLVPLYTSVLTTTQYGTYDLLNTTIGILIPILTLNIMEAVVRFSIDDRTHLDAIVTVSTKFLIVSSLLVGIFIVISNLLNVFPILRNYGFYFWLMYVSQALTGIIVSFARGIDKVAAMSASSVIASVVMIVCNIVFLLVFKWGLSGYFLANIIGPLIQCLYLIWSTGYFKYINFNVNYQSSKKKLVAYSSPLIANSIAWWVTNVSDRYIVTWFCGLAANGVYSVATKIPSILSVAQTIFNQAWILSAVKDFDPEDKDGFFANTYKVYNGLMVVICSLIIFFDRFVASFLYAKNFYAAWKYVPFLTIAILFGAISGYIGGFFTAKKATKIFATSTVYGAIINIILNIVLVPFIGAMGSSFATMVCYIVIWAIRFIQSKKYIHLKINVKKDVLAYVLLIVQSILLISFSQEILVYSLQTLIIAVILVIYFNDVKFLLRKMAVKFMN